MGLRIYQNIEAINAHRNLGISSDNLGKAMEKLSSGLRINRAGDDAAGLAISEKLRSQVKGLNQAVRNSQDGISLIQTAEGALVETHSILQRIRELSVQAANGTLENDDRGQIQEEVAQLIEEVTRIATATQFNGKQLISGSFATSAITFQVGANATQGIGLTIGAMDATALTIGALNVSTQTGADAAILSLDTAIAAVSSQRANLGAVQNRLEHTIANLGVAAENLAASESRIRDVDMALEMVNYTKQQILQQAGTAMLAQANTAPQAVLQLLR
jgi:flagellin